MWRYVIVNAPEIKGKYCIHCCEFLCAIHLIIIFLFAFATLFREDSFNYTAMTHALPNILLMGGYVLDGREISDNLLPNGNETMSIPDRITEESFFLPPNQYFEVSADNVKNLDLNSDEFHKFDSVPFIFRDIALPRASSTKKNPTTGTSLFVTNLKNRGNTESGIANKKKIDYMKGLTQKEIQTHVRECTKSMENIMNCKGNLQNCIYDAVRDITFIIHTGKKPGADDKEFIDSGVDAFSSVSSISDVIGGLFMPAVVQKHILKHDNYKKELENKLTGGLFKLLKFHGYSTQDILVEYLHNIFALTIQWTLLMENMLEHKVNSTSEAIYNHLQDNPVAGFISSAKRPITSAAPTHKLHRLKQIMKGGAKADDSNFKKCPFASDFIVSDEGAIIVSNTTILEQDQHWAFGKGYRRCAGEVLTVEMMKKWSTIYLAKNYTYNNTGTVGYFGLGYKRNSTIMVYPWHE